MIGIYKITNATNGKVYIGKSTNIERRWAKHLLPSYQLEKKQPIYLAFIKYGVQNFKFEVVEICGAEELDEKEKYWISHYDSYNTGYNATTGGDGSSPGSANPNSILAVEEVKEIKLMYKQGFFPSQIHEKFHSVTKSAIADIIGERSWTHVKVEEEVEKVKVVDPRGQNNRKITKDLEDKIYTMSLDGKSVPQIMRELNLNGVISKSGVYAAISRRKKNNG